MTSGTCPVCGKPWEWDGRGSPRKYCSAACNQRAYRNRRHTDGSTPMPLYLREFIRGEITAAELERRSKANLPGEYDPDALAAFELAHGKITSLDMVRRLIAPTVGLTLILGGLWRG